MDDSFSVEEALGDGKRGSDSFSVEEAIGSKERDSSFSLDAAKKFGEFNFQREMMSAVPLGRQAAAAAYATANYAFDRSKPFADYYEEGLQGFDAAKDQYEKDHHARSLAARGIGLLTSGGGAAGAVAKAPGLGEAALEGAKIGAGYGAAQGVSDSDLTKPGETAKNAARGGVEGAIGGAGLAAVPGLARKGAQFVKTAIGRESTAAGDALRSAEKEILERLGLNQRQEAERYASRVQAAEKSLESLKGQPATAETRAAQRAARSPNFADERERVLDDLRSRSRALEEEAKAAGASADEAKATVAAHEGRVAEAEGAVDDLEKRMLSSPTISADEFGKELRTSTERLFKKYNDARSTRAGFGTAVEGAGDTLRIDTSKLKSGIREALKGVRNPALERTLGEVSSLLETQRGEGVENALSVKSADSLRKYLDGIISSRSVGERAVDKETLHEVGRIRDDLVKATEEAWTPYKEAMARYRELSRPLDIVERNGALRHVLDTDPVSSAYKLTEAEVAKAVIGKAKAGNPVFSRLLEESPGLRDASRLAFAEDLLGKEKAPSEAQFRNWLRANERPLKQLGLLDEFKDMKSAREAAARAVKEAKGQLSESREHAATLDKAEREIIGKLKGAQSLRAKEAARIAQKQLAEEKAGALSGKTSDRRATEAQSRLERRAKEAQGGQESAQRTEDRIRQMNTELDSVDAKEVGAKAQSIAKQLRSQGLIDDAAYADTLRRIARAEALHGHTAETRRVLKKILGYTIGGGALATVGYETVKHFE